jgi:hypothetical protein
MAEFYQGFTFECDVKGRLTIEGNPVQVVAAPDDGVDLRCSADDGTPVGLARAYIDSSVELRARERERAEHLRILRSGKAAWNQCDASIQRSIRCSLAMISPNATATSFWVMCKRPKVPG